MLITNNTEMLTHMLDKGYTLEYKGLTLCTLRPRFSGQAFTEYQVYSDKYQCKTNEIFKHPIKAVRHFLIMKDQID
jgi:hypothetical protein